MAAAQSNGRRPNVLILFPDQLRWSEVGCYGNKDIHTPAIDRLAESGVRFVHAYSNRPVCSPARSILLSGRYARCNGVMSNQNDEAQIDRPTNRDVTLAEVLGKAGYKTGLVGKWHLRPSPPTLGFQESVRSYFRHRYYRQIFDDNEDEKYVYDGFGPEHETRAAIEFIRRHRDEPFLLYVAYGPPHMPLAETPEKYRTMYDPASVPLRKNVWVDGQLAYNEEWFKIYLWDFQYYNHKETFPQRLPEGFDLRHLTALYYGAVTAIDEQIGRVLAALRESGLDEDTIVVLTSDHGDLLGSHGLFNKDTHHDEAARIPMIFRYPRAFQARVAGRCVASLVHVMPTILDLCGVPVPPSVQGESLAPVLAGRAETLADNAAYIETGPADGIRTERYCYFADRKRPEREQLFDVEADPYELSNLAGDASHQAVLASLRERVRKWQARTPAASRPSRMP